MPSKPKDEKKFSPGLVLKADDSTGLVTAITNVFGIVDTMDDIIVPGAFAKSIVERGRKIRVLDQHSTNSVTDIIATMAGIREIGRDELPSDLLAGYPEALGGLECTMQFMMDDPRSAAVYRRLAMGAADEWSIGFNALKQDFGTAMWRGEERSVRYIREVRLWEVSAVIWGANQATYTATVKSVDEVRPWLVRMIGEEKAGRVLSEKNAARIQGAVGALVDVLTEAGVMKPAEDDGGDKAQPEQERMEAEPQGEALALTSRDRLLKLIELEMSEVTT